VRSCARRSTTAFSPAPPSTGVIDFSSVVASPYDPQAINPAYDSGDHLHPNDVGYQVMGDTVPLRLLLGDHG
jgi:lysophospholipase L1-like esterase